MPCSLLFLRIFYDRFASATGLSQLHPGFFQVQCILRQVLRTCTPGFVLVLNEPSVHNTAYQHARVVGYRRELVSHRYNTVRGTPNTAQTNSYVHLPCSDCLPEFEDASASASNDKDAYFASLLQRLQVSTKTCYSGRVCPVSLVGRVQLLRPSWVRAFLILDTRHTCTPQRCQQHFSQLERYKGLVHGSCAVFPPTLIFALRCTGYTSLFVATHPQCIEYVFFHFVVSGHSAPMPCIPLPGHQINLIQCSKYPGD